MSRHDILANVRKILRLLNSPYTHAKYKRKGGKFGLRDIKKYFGSWDQILVELADKGEVSDGLQSRIIDALQKPITVIELANNLNTSPKAIYRAINDLRKKGIEVCEIGVTGEIDSQFYIDKPKNVKPENKNVKHFVKGNHVKVGMISDTHIGSKMQQLTYLRDFYHLCAEEGVDTIYHAGDVFAGNGKIYRGQEFEIFINGIDECVNYFCEEYPKIDGITTKFITGNHDLSWYTQQGIDVGKQIELRRDDLEYMGQLASYVEITTSDNKPGPRMYLIHPDAGASYARSYKPQKIVEGLSSENKPEILAIGHYHVSGYFDIRNVHVFLASCFEAQTPYLKRKSLMPNIGGWILDLEITDDNSIVSIVQKYIKYFTPIPHDYKL
jgi:predicted phosphodiesterase